MIHLNGELRNTRCGPNLHCPDDTYCNTLLMDTYSTCCLSHPEAPVKPGSCPASEPAYFSNSVCFNTCNNDGDCRGHRKCCQTGCSRQCLAPQRVLAQL
ncbi:wap four-disulfide core domain protein 18 [Plakobranchus ocellatus]|uniref:Wap four-disulfide core domain protein 18 n=1 Tax=Plakobranchus ocellatus TaxID=259542 RepID=A0AAV3YF65_9GAST|nr:wap four-disulfide core domain protein 18 [Plakobranchus ocellatus]